MVVRAHYRSTSSEHIVVERLLDQGGVEGGGAHGGCRMQRQPGGVQSFQRYGFKSPPSLLNSVMDVTLVSCSNEKVVDVPVDDVALMEPTSVLDLQTRPSRSYSSASLSSQHSFSSSDGSSPVTTQQEPAADHRAASVFKEEHAVDLPADCISDSDIANWMECLMDPNLAFNVLPEFGSLESSCDGAGLDFSAACSQMKLEWNDVAQFSGAEIGFEFEMSLDESASDSGQSFSLQFPVASGRCDHEMLPTESAAGPCLLHDEAPMFVVPGQLSEVWFTNRAAVFSQVVPSTRLKTKAQASFASMPMQAESIVPTAEVLRLLTTPQSPLNLPPSTLGDKSVRTEAPLQHGSPSGESLINVLHLSRPSQLTSRQILQEENTGLDLVHFLLGSAEAIDACDLDIAHALLTRLRAKASPHGDPMKRIAFYFADALGARLSKEAAMNSSTLNYKPCATPTSSPLQSDLAYQASYEILPFEKFTHFTGNQAIFEAMLGYPKLHIVDLNIRQGLQWPGLIQALAVRQGGPPGLLRITAIGLDVSALRQTGKRLAHFADSLQVRFEYCVVLESLENLQPTNIRVEADEILAVNCSSVLHSLFRFNHHGVLENVLGTIRALNPIVVSLLEVEANHNAPNFIARFVEALHYYCALFDSLEATRPGRDSIERLQIEKFCFAPQINDIIGCEGTNRRARHVRWETWRSFFTDSGFRSLPLSTYAADQAQLLLGLYQASPGDMSYKLTGDNGVLTLGWQDTPVTTVSSWSC